MKRYFTIGVLLCMATATAVAQKANFGMRIGANVYQNKGGDIDNAYRAFPFGGLYLGLETQKFTVSVEGLFTQTKIIAGNNFNTVYSAYIQNGKQQIQNAEFDFTELSVPLVLGLKLGNSIILEAGPQFTKIVNMSDREKILTETKNVYKNSYISGLAGLKIKLPLHLSLSGRYVMGITNRNNTTVNERWSTQHFQIGIGYGW